MAAPLAQTQSGLTVDVVVVLAVVGFAVVLFLTEVMPVDVTAILLMVVLALLEPWTTISPTDAISGFANEATVTVLAMLILSSGVSRTGVVQELGRRMTDFAGTSLRRQLLATVGITSPLSGFLNNTPVVALLVPVVTDLANRGDTSPSKLLIPLSYASQLGGMLTLVGTSTNILASDISARLGRRYPELHRFSMFEFTQLGVVVVLVGGAYLLFVGHRLLPERVPPNQDFLDTYDVGDYVAELALESDSRFVGESVETVTDELGAEIDIVEVVRDHTETVAPRQAVTLRAGDSLVVRTNRAVVAEPPSFDGMDFVRGDPVIDTIETTERATLAELVVAIDSRLVGERLSPERFRDEYGAAVLGLRSPREGLVERIVGRRLQVGDTLLVEVPEETVPRLSREPDFIVAYEPPTPDYRTEKAPVAVAILAGVVGLATAELLPLLISALGGVVAMVLTGVLEPNELYDAVEWDVIFLLAGVIPLGIALERTGAASVLATGIVVQFGTLPPAVVLWLFYIMTGLITEVISNNASVVLLIPVAAASAAQIGANPFAFVLAVTFAASTAFLGPVGYQTNLFVYGPGGYRFGDYVRIGAPLQLLQSVVVTVGIVALWGV
ncbi:SLC13 family permease [Haloarcula onubensis]|uniref:SLC13 family permease n=1 Tax=Haloarcula onubensis TaxID=2950539 RepID=A0ABU2FUY5_9EURY|nr:SLC13 family permease [Halomicroarcula sp. S3CR25-11]MDS0284579.1 SLC13 family permease [Halomicroarcula sp. S3CR25-11]